MQLQGAIPQRAEGFAFVLTPNTRKYEGTARKVTV